MNKSQWENGENVWMPNHCAVRINKISGLRAQVVINLIKDPDVKNTVYQKISTQAPSLPTFSQQKTYMYIYSDMIIVKTKTEAHKKASGCKVEVEWFKFVRTS
ncbi:hypothetical protein MAR_035603 [Mya arenaria]|uniref:Uncharacterized protein n=1 Tax=Mya arenaria TaxID=6604 RepID=A0ABY7ENH2_MYAAR|nr:hypothetical protein MAR_035603 [Mya arenaria]